MVLLIFDNGASKNRTCAAIINHLFVLLSSQICHAHNIVIHTCSLQHHCVCYKFESVIKNYNCDPSLRCATVILRGNVHCQVINYIRQINL